MVAPSRPNGHGIASTPATPPFARKSSSSPPPPSPPTPKKKRNPLSWRWPEASQRITNEYAVGPTRNPQLNTPQMIWSSFSDAVWSPPPLFPLLKHQRSIRLASNSTRGLPPLAKPSENSLNPAALGSHHSRHPWPAAAAAAARLRRREAGRWRARRGSGAGRRRRRRRWRGCSRRTAGRGRPAPRPRSRCSASTPRSAPSPPSPWCGSGAHPAPPPPPRPRFVCLAPCRLSLTSESVLRLQARAVLGEGGAGDAPRSIAVHPAGDELVCATATGCRCAILLVPGNCLLVRVGVCGEILEWCVGARTFSRRWIGWVCPPARAAVSGFCPFGWFRGQCWTVGLSRPSVALISCWVWDSAGRWTAEFLKWQLTCYFREAQSGRFGNLEPPLITHHKSCFLFFLLGWTSGAAMLPNY
jgi:hypothetical protein